MKQEEEGQVEAVVAEVVEIPVVNIAYVDGALSVDYDEEEVEVLFDPEDPDDPENGDPEDPEGEEPEKPVVIIFTDDENKQVVVNYDQDAVRVLLTLDPQEEVIVATEAMPYEDDLEGEAGDDDEVPFYTAVLLSAGNFEEAEDWPEPDAAVAESAEGEAEA